MISHMALPDSHFHQKRDSALLGDVSTVQVTELGLPARALQECRD